MIILVTIITLLTVILEVPPLIIKKMWKELTTTVSLLLIAVFIQISSNLSIQIPIGLIKKVFEPIGKMFFTKL